jgi:hypothetical protein
VEECAEEIAQANEFNETSCGKTNGNALRLEKHGFRKSKVQFA